MSGTLVTTSFALACWEGERYVEETEDTELLAELLLEEKIFFFCGEEDVATMRWTTVVGDTTLLAVDEDEEEETETEEEVDFVLRWFELFFTAGDEEEVEEEEVGRRCFSGVKSAKGRSTEATKLVALPLVLDDGD